MSGLKRLFELFIVFFKVGLFTIGGGYAMISVLEHELIEKKNWIDKDAFLDIIAIAESSPGPIAINTATFVGYKRHKVFGAIVATLGFVLPSFIIITVISLLIERFDLLELKYVEYAFNGINACVAFLILNAGIKLLKKQKKNIFNIVLTFATVVSFVLLTLFNVSFSAVYFILIGCFTGLLTFWIPLMISKAKRGGKR